MTEALLAGIRVVDLAGEPAAMAGRILADLGAEVILVEPPDGHPLRALPRRFLAWGAGKASVAVDGPDDPHLDELLATADVVIDTPGFPGRVRPRPGTRARRGLGARHAVRRHRPARRLAGVRPRRDGREREHVRHRRPRPAAGAVHRAVGRTRTRAPRPRSPRSPRWRRARPHRVDISMQEVVFVANMVGARLASRRRVTGERGAAPTSAAPARSGRARTAGSRSGCAAARRASRASTTLTRLIAEEDGIDAGALTGATGPSSRQNTATDDELQGHRAAGRRVLRPPHDAGAVRDRVRDEPHARAVRTRRARSTPAPSWRRGSSSARSATSTASRARS